MFADAIQVLSLFILLQGRMERLEIESASSDASSMILASWPVDLRQDQAGPASPAGASDASPQSRSGKAALALTDSGASASPPQQSPRMGKQRLLEAVIQPGMQAHIQVSCRMFLCMWAEMRSLACKPYKHEIGPVDGYCLGLCSIVT